MIVNYDRSVITIVNYDCKPSILQATEVNLIKRFSLSLMKATDNPESFANFKVD